MKFFAVTILLSLVAATIAHPPPASSSSSSEESDEKPIADTSTESKSDDKLPVTIYYEGLCPDSRKLMADLGREYYLFKKYINLEFVPFGRAKSLDAEGNEFECHHGPKECVSNRVHSCGIKYLKSQDAKQQFVVCQMRTEADQTGKEVRQQLRAFSLSCFCFAILCFVLLQVNAIFNTKTHCFSFSDHFRRSVWKRLAVTGLRSASVSMVTKARDCN